MHESIYQFHNTFIIQLSYTVIDFFVCANYSAESDVNSSLTSKLFDAVQFQRKKLRKARNVEYYLDGVYIITMKTNGKSMALHLISDIPNAPDDPPPPHIPAV